MSVTVFICSSDEGDSGKRIIGGGWYRNATEWDHGEEPGGLRKLEEWTCLWEVQTEWRVTNGMIRRMYQRDIKLCFVYTDDNRAPANGPEGDLIEDDWVELETKWFSFGGR